MGAISCSRELRYSETITTDTSACRGSGFPEGDQGCPWDAPYAAAGPTGYEEAFPDKPVGELSCKELGYLGEELAARYLLEIGFDILERNYRCSEGEADIVAFDPDDDCVVLAEVKTRREAGADDGTYAEEAVDERKRRRYRRIAASYLMDNFPVPSIRFDILAVAIFSDRTHEIHHVPGAYDWEAER